MNQITWRQRFFNRAQKTEPKTTGPVAPKQKKEPVDAEIKIEAAPTQEPPKQLKADAGTKKASVAKAGKQADAVTKKADKQDAVAVAKPVAVEPEAKPEKIVPVKPQPDPLLGV